MHGVAVVAAGILQTVKKRDLFDETTPKYSRKYSRRVCNKPAGIATGLAAFTQNPEFFKRSGSCRQREKATTKLKIAVAP
jgi:hypothetical protein